MTNENEKLELRASHVGTRKETRLVESVEAEDPRGPRKKRAHPHDPPSLRAHPYEANQLDAHKTTGIADTKLAVEHAQKMPCQPS